MSCRAIACNGDVHFRSELDAGPGEALRADAEIAGDRWVSLAPSARLVAKDPRSARETTFLGPAEARVCVGRREESWLASGSFESTTGAGEAPGAEEWVDTPLAVVRYASAKLRIVVRPDKTTVTSAGGVAFVWVADGALLFARGSDAGAARGGTPEEPWLRLSEGTIELRPSKLGSALHREVPPEVAWLLDAAGRCSSLAEQSEGLARRILAHVLGEGGSAPTADEMARQVTTRRLARAACAVAQVRARSLPPSDFRAELLKELDQAETRWSTLPLASAESASP
jgi:hypothetical protein